MHKRIRIARGDSSTQVFKDTIPENGQPVYDTKNNKLYIGDGNKALKDLDDIQVSNVTSTIDGKPITGTNGIFESDGITAKSATNAENAENAIKNSDNSYSGFTQNANNILKANTNEIISKKRLIYNGAGIFGPGRSSTITFTEGINHLDSVEFLISDYGITSPYMVSNCKFIHDVGSNKLKGATNSFSFKQIGNDQGLMFFIIEFESDAGDTTNVTEFNVNLLSVFANSTSDHVSWGTNQSVSILEVYKIIE